MYVTSFVIQQNTLCMEGKHNNNHTLYGVSLFEDWMCEAKLFLFDFIQLSASHAHSLIHHEDEALSDLNY